MRVKIYIILLAALTIAFTADVFGASNTVSIVAIENAWVSGDSDNDESEAARVKRNNPYGSGGNGAGANICYLRVELEEVSRIKQVTGAALDFYVVAIQDGSTSFRVAALDDGYTNAVRYAETNWTATLNRTNAPGITPSAGGVPNTETSSMLGQELADGTVGTVVSVSLDAAMMNDLVLNDSNGELTLIVYGTPGASGYVTIASVSNSGGHPKPTLTISGDFKPPLGTVVRLY